MNELQKCAEILVECGHAKHLMNWTAYPDRPTHIFIGDDHVGIVPDPFSDTLEGRRQADAIEDWLHDKQNNLWLLSADEELYGISNHQWRLDRIKWCIQELIK